MMSQTERQRKRMKKRMDLDFEGLWDDYKT